MSNVQPPESNKLSCQTDTFRNEINSSPRVSFHSTPLHFTPPNVRGTKTFRYLLLYCTGNSLVRKYTLLPHNHRVQLYNTESSTSDHRNPAEPCVLGSWSSLWSSFPHTSAMVHACSMHPRTPAGTILKFLRFHLMRTRAKRIWKIGIHRQWVLLLIKVVELLTHFLKMNGTDSFHLGSACNRSLDLHFFNGVPSPTTFSLFSKVPYPTYLPYLSR